MFEIYDEQSLQLGNYVKNKHLSFFSNQCYRIFKHFRSKFDNNNIRKINSTTTESNILVATLPTIYSMLRSENMGNKLKKIFKRLLSVLLYMVLYMSDNLIYTAQMVTLCWHKYS